MFRIDHPTAVASVPTPAAAGDPGFFTKGSPADAIPATVLTDDWANSIQEELAYVIEQAGITLSKTNRTQLRAAIQAMITGAQQAIIISSAVFNAGVSNGNAVYWDSGNSRFDKALADGSAKQNMVGFADVTNSKVYAFGDAVLFSGLTPGKYYLSGTTAGAITATAPSGNTVVVGIAKSATEIFVDIDAQSGGSAHNVGDIFDYAGTTAPPGSLVCPTSQTNISRTTYAALFAKIGTTWGAGDGSTTFGMPWFPADYVASQANSNVGTQTTGQVIAHTHTYLQLIQSAEGTAGTQFHVTDSNGNQPTSSTGGTANLAAGVRVLKCVQYQ